MSEDKIEMRTQWIIGGYLYDTEKMTQVIHIPPYQADPGHGDEWLYVSTNGRWLHVEMDQDFSDGYVWYPKARALTEDEAYQWLSKRTWAVAEIERYFGSRIQPA